jgi:outer membrane protein assembly factor BamB
MPVDLDDMFATLGRHADAIPLAPPVEARHRGRQRTRTRALVAAAAAVCLVAAGVGGVLSRQEHEAAPALAPVGTPTEFGGQARADTAIGADGRAYTVWQTLDGTIRMNALELRTGAVAWPVREVGSRTDTIVSVNALPRAVTLMLEHAEGGDSARTMYFYDPADGRQRWELPLGNDDTVVTHESVLVRTSAGTGRTEAFDWATGASRWRLPAQSDRPVQTLGMVTDEMWAGYSVGRVTPTTDDRLVQVTEAGKVQVRDIRTGALSRTVTSVAPDKDPRTFFGYDGMLYNDEHECCDNPGYRIRVTDLRTDRGTSKVLLTEGAGHELTMMMPCGPQRLCLLDRQRNGTSTLSAIDRGNGRRVWQRPTADEYPSMSYLNGYLLVGGAEGDRVVYDRDGRQVFSTSAKSVQWLDGNNLLLLQSPQAGPVSKVTIPNGKAVPLGELPASSDACASTTNRLVCPAITDLRIWSLTG